MTWYKPMTREAAFTYGLMTGGLMVAGLWALMHYGFGAPVQ
jgi:hypothetical protein